MEESVRRFRSRSFGSVADVYEQSRPGYPRDAVRWLLADLLPEPIPPYDVSAFDSYAVTPDPSYAAPDPAIGYPTTPPPPSPPPPTVVELAAGTGKMTAVLAAEGHRVIAVEPSAPLLLRLIRNVPEATPVQAVAEQIPLADGSADAVVVAHAFHWFDTDAALAEIARVLRPGGILGLLWNYRDESVPWVRQLSSLLAAAERLEARQAEDLIEKLEWSRLFTPPEYAGFRLWQPVNREGLLQMVASRSSVASLPPAEREDVLKQVGDLYDETARQPEGLVMPYITACYRMRVRK